MSTQLTSGRAFDGGYEPVCMYDTTDGMAFGPTFADRTEAHAFMRWLDKQTDYAPITPLTADKSTADRWRAFEADHPETECPYDGDDVDEPGWTNATDHEYNDGSPAMAHPDRCDCECHTKTGGRWSAERRGR